MGPPLQPAPGTKPWQHEGWLIFKDNLLQAQQQSIPTSRKSDKSAKMPVCLNTELLALRNKKEANKGWK